MSAYDKAKWHYDGDFPKDLDQYQAFVHTGLFLGWIIDQGLYSEEFEEDFEQEIIQFRHRELTGPAIYHMAGGVFSDDMLSEIGDAFTSFYFDLGKGAYLADYENLLAVGLPSTYHVQDSWENYHKLKPVIDRRFADWQRSQGR